MLHSSLKGDIRILNRTISTNISRKYYYHSLQQVGMLDYTAIWIFYLPFKAKPGIC